jgi:hypothetical protein
MGVGLAPADRLGTALCAPVVVMASAARQFQLAPTQLVEVPAAFEVFAVPRLDRRIDRRAARLQGDIRRQTQQLVGLVGKRRLALVACAAQVDAPLDVDKPGSTRIKPVMAGCHFLRARARVTETRSARLAAER